VPRYRLVDESGPDHSKSFTVECRVAGKTVGTGSGGSKKSAEQAAARTALGSRSLRELLDA
jgi:ribonuclease-3